MKRRSLGSGVSGFLFKVSSFRLSGNLLRKLETLNLKRFMGNAHALTLPHTMLWGRDGWGATNRHEKYRLELFFKRLDGNILLSEQPCKIGALQL